MSVLFSAHCRTVNLDGTHRLLHMSVSDEVRGAQASSRHGTVLGRAFDLPTTSCWALPCAG